MARALSVMGPPNIHLQLLSLHHARLQVWRGCGVRYVYVFCVAYVYVYVYMYVHVNVYVYVHVYVYMYG